MKLSKEFMQLNIKYTYFPARELNKPSEPFFLTFTVCMSIWIIVSEVLRVSFEGGPLKQQFKTYNQKLQVNKQIILT